MVIGLLATIACHASQRTRSDNSSEDRLTANGGPRPAVISVAEGERRMLRQGTAAVWIKVDPVTTGSQRMVLGTEDIGPGDAIGVHRHLREDEIIFIHRGSARIQLGARHYAAGVGATVYIPQGTCVAVANAGSDTLNMVFVFSSPGFEQVLRDVSSRENDPPKIVPPADRIAAFHRGHAVVNPTDC
ncbi:MAG: hypothetical protein NVS4B3_05260 [Gemmatimonadaceae bacterium]